MRAAWWWIDRWRKSTAYTDMTLAEQGAYRNLLDELWLRDGLLPADERILAKISGGPFEWSEVRDAVLSHFIRVDDGYRNETHDQVMSDSKYRAEKQKRYRDRRKNVTGNVTQSPSPSPSPSKSKDQTPKTEHDSARRKRRATVYPDHFEAFWNEYPKKTGKRKALESWKRLVDADARSEVIAAVVRHRTENPKWVGGFVHDPTTWINGEMWLDEFSGNGMGRTISKAQERQNQNIAAIKAAREADDALERRVRPGGRDDGGGLWGDGDTRKNPHLLAHPEG